MKLCVVGIDRGSYTAWVNPSGHSFLSAHAAYENHARWLVNLGDFRANRMLGFRQERVARLTRLLKMWDRKRS